MNSIFFPYFFGFASCISPNLMHTIELVCSENPNTNFVYFIITDVDECSMGMARCHRSQECINTIGSYKCVARCEKGFKRTTDGLACIGE